MPDQVSFTSNDEGEQVTFYITVDDGQLVSFTAFDSEQNEFDVCLQITQMRDGRPIRPLNVYCCCPLPEGGLICQMLGGSRCPACSVRNAQDEDDDEDGDDQLQEAV